MKRFLLLCGVGVILALVLLFPKSASQPPAPVVSADVSPAQHRTLAPTQSPVSLLSTPETLKPTMPAATATEPDAFDAFDGWARQFLSAQDPPAPAVGIALAWKRREAMIQLIQQDPKKALERTIPFEWRRALPQGVSRHFETLLDAKGAMEVTVATDFERGKATVRREAQVGERRYQVFTYGRRLQQGSRSKLPLHGIAIDDKLALHVDPLRILSRAEAAALAAAGQQADPICGVSGQTAEVRNTPTAADVGGEVRLFCGVDHAQMVNERWLAGEQNRADFGMLAADGGSDWTHGPKTLLYIRVNFPDDLTEPITEAQAYSAINGVNAYYTEISYDMTAIDTTVTPLITMPKPKAWYSTSGPGGLQADAREAARKAGFETGNYDRDIVAFTSIEGYDFGGLASVGGKGVWLQSTGVGVTSHELGHNYGLWHANFWNAITNSSIIGPGTNFEYGNIFDTMGSGGVAQFNAMHKSILEWIPPAAIHQATSNGTYRIYPFDSPNRVSGRFYAIRAPKDYQRDYWIEFRQKFTGNPWLQHGVLLNWSPWPESAGGTHMLDTTPGTPTGSDSREDSAVVIGRTFTDPGAGVHITTLGRGATGTNSWIDVQVNLGAFPGNSPPRCRLEIEPTNATPGTAIHFHVNASDPDGDPLAYAWSFDDLTFSTNNLPWTYKLWPGSGDHLVRCIVSDMKGGVASVNGLVTIGARTGFRIGGRVLDINGVPLENAHVNNAPTNIADYIGGFTDSEGRYLIVGATAELTLAPVKYGYTFTNSNFTNPISATSDVLNADFVAIPMTFVTLKASTNSIPENLGLPQTVTLSRSGDISNSLTVSLYLSGTAGLGGDYSLSPALSNGLNFVEIPAGSNSVVFTLQVGNDGTIEGPETVALTLVEDDDYVIGSPGVAVVTIADDDLPVRPSVSALALTPIVMENATDALTFLISRNGSTQNGLVVNYSVGGTATAGADYGIPLGVVMIPPGQSSATVSFPLIEDKILEGEETATLTLTPNAAYIVSGSSPQIRILDQDLLTVTVSPTSANLAEPTAAGRFTVKRDGDLTANLVVNYTVSGTATSDSDFSALPGTVTIPAGSASADIVVTALDDALVEGDESVVITLSTNIAYNIGTPGTATLRVRDNEKITVNISAPDSAAGEPGDDVAAFRISRGTVVNGTLIVNLAISGTAIPGADYVPLDSVVVIPDGSSGVDLEVIAFDDLHQEPDDDIRLSILSSTNFNIGGTGQARVVITDNDGSAVPAVGFSLNASAAEESKSPGISVSLSATSTSPISVEFVIIGGTASSSDYVFNSGPLMFQPGDRAITFPLQIVNDSLVEPNETIRLALFNPQGATLDGIKLHTYTILDDDTASVSVTATAAAADESGPVPGNFRITRSGNTSSNLVVNFEITGTAGSPGDYPALGTSATIPAGATFVDLPVMPINDQTVEYDETVELTLLTAAGARIVPPNSATIVISDNDSESLPIVSVTSTNAPAAVEGGANGEFLFTRSGSTAGALTVYFSLTGTAVNTLDYSTIGGSVEIPDGAASVTLPVVAVNDALVEGEETVVLALSLGETYRAAYPSTAIVTVQDNDQRVRVDGSDFAASEPGTDLGAFTFTRFGTTNTDLQVFFTISGTAGNGVDYATISNSFTIPAGSLSATLPITPLDDLLVEGPEKVTLTLQSGPAYSLDALTVGTVIISDDEPMLVITAPSTNIVEGGKPPGVFRLIRTGDPKYNFTARFADGGTAAFGIDYPPIITNVYFSCGVTAIDLVISATNELIVESAETVTASLLPDPAYTILAPSNALMTIIDAGTNKTPLVTITSPTANIVFLQGTNVNIILEATVLDDADTNSPPTNTWSKVSGPDTFSFSDTNQANTTISFTNVGVYLLRLTADDGKLQGFAEVTVVVGAVEMLSSNLLHWALDETSGSTVSDSSGAARHGVVVGPGNWTTNGVMGGATRLFGTNDHLRQTAGTNFLNGMQELTLSLWIKLSNTNSGQAIFSANDSDTNTSLSLIARALASCGNSTNVLEAALRTSEGEVRHVSANNLVTNDWQHLTLSWSNGLAPALYINGRLDQPLSHMVAASGYITNSPQFLVGRGNGPSRFNGWIDDVRVFARALTLGEAAALGSLPPTNYGAVVDAGPDVTVQLINPFVLSGKSTDDGNPIPPGVLSNSWSVVTGAVSITLTNPTSLTNTIQFTQAGEYIFRLIGDDGQVKVFDDVTVTVIVPTTVDVSASDAEAAELGPDTGQFTFTRNGDIDFDLTVALEMSGIASNGVDFIALTNFITFPAGSNMIVFDVVPFLDYPIEGDEPVTYTIISNLAYSIGNGTATVTIHDSPYGMWSIEHFTLEELTDPTLSGAAADFDFDSLVNFAEYAANLDPKAPDASGPILAALEVAPSDGSNHVTITYHRRVEPTDTEYVVAISSDLVTWNTGTNYVEEVEVTDDGNMLTETVQARVLAPLSPSTPQFVTVLVWLRVTGPP